MIARWGVRVAACALAMTFVAASVLGAKRQGWVEVRSPHFVIISNAGNRAAIDADLRFEQIRTLFREAIPGEDGGAYEPVITVFAVKDEDAMRELLPEYWARGHVHPAGIYFSRLDQTYAAVRLDAPGENPYEPLYHEYFHALHSSPDWPLWLSEGLAAFYGNTSIRDSKAYMGEEREECVQLLKRQGLMPLGVLFGVDRKSRYYTDESLSPEFYAESWALTHLLMISKHGANRHMLDDYLAAVGRGAPAANAAKAFGNLGELEDALQRYIASYRFDSYVAPAPPQILRSELNVRQLANAEIEAGRGGFEAVRGDASEARPILEEAVRLDPGLALAYQNLALEQLFEGQRAQARATLDRAISLDPGNALCRYLRAYLRVTQRGAVARDAETETDLRESVDSDPDFAPAAALLAVYLSANPASLPEALRLAKRAVTLQPGTSDFGVALAQVLMRMSRYDEAQAALRRARAAARTPAERAEANQVFAALQAAQLSGERLAGTPVAAPRISAQAGTAQAGAAATAVNTGAAAAAMAPQF